MCPRTAPASLAAVLTVPNVVTGVRRGTPADARTAGTGPTRGIVGILLGAGTTVETAADVTGTDATTPETARAGPRLSAADGRETVNVKREPAVRSRTPRTEEVRAVAAAVAPPVVKRTTSVAGAHLLNFSYLLK